MPRPALICRAAVCPRCREVEVEEPLEAEKFKCGGAGRGGPAGFPSGACLWVLRNGCMCWQVFSYKHGAGPTIAFLLWLALLCSRS